MHDQGWHQGYQLLFPMLDTLSQTGLLLAAQRSVCLSLQLCAAVEGSKRMAEAAQSIVEENQLSSGQGGPIAVLSGRIEELQALPMQQVIPVTAEVCDEFC